MKSTRRYQWFNGSGAATQPTFQTPDSGIWRISRVMFTCQTSAVAGNRYFGPVIYQKGSLTLEGIYVDSGTQAASLGRTHCWISGSPLVLGVDAYIVHSLPDDMVFDASTSYPTVILLSSDAGDRYSGQRILLERMED